MAEVVLGVGLGLQLIGNIKGASDEAKAERENARSLREQAEYSRQVAARKMELLARDQRQFTGRKKAAIAKSGVSLSGSILDTLVDDQVEMEKERVATRAQMEFEIRHYGRLASNADSRARNLQTTALLGAGGQILTGASRFLEKD
jgi:hypothetical protein